jgi:transcriptional regulator with XRE-family HTH domain
MNPSIYSNEYKFLISQLKKARLELKLTQKEVADRLGRTQSYISKVEMGQLRVDIIQLKEFSKLYRKDLDYFIR